MKILVIGSVNTTAYVIKKLVEHSIEVAGVIGYMPRDNSLVSGWFDLEKLAGEYNLDFLSFTKINEESIFRWAERKKPDVIFAVGFSQLLHKKWLDLPRLGCVGFHPTLLPKGRGRAPIAWSVLCEEFGSATFFKMGEGADDGPIFVQSVFTIDKTDDATTVERKIEKSIYKALDSWLPNFKTGEWEPQEQNHNSATWYGKREPSDGHIDFKSDNYSIDRLIKASTKPHPGAYTYFNDTKLIVWKSTIENNYSIKGVPGSVLVIDDIKGYLVQCGKGLLWLKDIEISSDVKLKVGSKLGYNLEDEVYFLKKQIQKLNEK